MHYRYTRNEERGQKNGNIRVKCKGVAKYQSGCHALYSHRFVNVMQKLNYHSIKVTVCPDGRCIEKLSDEVTFTAEISDPVINATVVENKENANNSACTVSWLWEGMTYPGSVVIFKA